MKIIQGDRCSGRTTTAVKMAIETGSILVVRTRAFADGLKRHNPGLKVIPIHSFLERHNTNDTYIIDDIDTFFDPNRVIAITTFGEVSKRLKQFKPDSKIKKIKRFFNGRQ